MSLALADALIDLGDPAELEKFDKDPETYMAEKDLNEMDKSALRSRNSGWIRYQAKHDAPTIADLELHQGEITAGVALDVIDVIDVVDVVVIL